MIKDNHKKDILKLLKGSTLRPSLYEILMSTSKVRYQDICNDFKCLAWVTAFNNSMVNLNLIATEERNNGGTFLWRKYDDITRLKLIDVKELPLYFDWRWKSDDFFRILKGEIEVACSRYVHRIKVK